MGKVRHLDKLVAAAIYNSKKKKNFLPYKKEKKIEFRQRGSVNDDQVSLNRVWSYIPP